MVVNQGCAQVFDQVLELINFSIQSVIVCIEKYYKQIIHSVNDVMLTFVNVSDL